MPTGLKSLCLSVANTTWRYARLLGTAASWPCKCVCRHGWRSSRNAPLETLEVQLFLTNRQSRDLLICFSISQLLTALQCSSNTWPLHLRSRTWKQQHTRLLRHIKRQSTKSLSMCRIHTAKRVGSEAGTKQMSFVYLIGICCSPKYLSTKGCSTKTASLIVCFGHFGEK